MACEDYTRLVGTGRRNLALRRQMSELRRNADTMFLALCDDQAVEAMGELWASGYFDCGPQDYPAIVELCLVALREYKERRTSPAPSPPALLCQADDYIHDRDPGDESDHIAD